MMKYISLFSALLLASCSSSAPSKTSGSLDSGKTMTGILYRVYDTELTASQQQWEKAIAKRAFEPPFWNEKRTQAVAYMRLRDSPTQVTHQFYYYRPNKEGWMELYGVREMTSDMYSMVSNITIGDDSYLISFWEDASGGSSSVTFTFPLENAHSVVEMMKGKSSKESSRAFDVKKIRFPHLAMPKP